MYLKLHDLQRLVEKYFSGVICREELAGWCGAISDHFEMYEFDREEKECYRKLLSQMKNMNQPAPQYVADSDLRVVLELLTARDLRKLCEFQLNKETVP